MKQLFDLNSPLMRFLTRVTDMLLLSFLIILFSIPIVTLSPSIIAASKVTQDMIYEEEGGIVKTFLTHFIKNLKQGILCSIITCAVIAIFAYDIFWLLSRQASISIILVVVLVIVSILFMGVIIRLHLLMARYHNSLRQHLFNAFVFTCWHFARSIFVAAIASIPGILLLFMPDLFLFLLPFLLAFFPGTSIFLFNLILKPSFQQIEDISAQNTSGDDS